MIRIAQIGIGYWGPNLLRNLDENPKCTISKVVDISDDRLSFVNQNYPNIQTTKYLDDVINDTKIDAVVIATPVSSHYDIATRALKKGKHILVEKPIATTVSEVNVIEKLSLENKLVAMVGHTFLFNSAVRHMKKIIDSGELGDIRYVYSQRLNLGRIRSDVDALWNLAPHDISIIQYWLDEPEPLKIFRQGLDFIQNGIDDVVFLNIQYPNRIIAHIHVSWLDPLKVRKMVVVGSKKMAVYDDIGENKIVVYDKGIDKFSVLGEDMDYDKQDYFQFSHRSGNVSIPDFPFVEPLKTEVNHFLKCISGEESCLTGPAHAKEVVRILSSATECE